MPDASHVKFDKVSFGFGRSTVLHELSFTAARGQFLAIVGPNGCGKSTTLKLLAGLHKPSAGHISVGDQPIGSMARRALARQVALLTQQSFAPPNMTVFDLVALGRFAHQTLLGRRSASDEVKIEAALCAMQVQDLAERRVGELSGGQLQRCRMAMTLAQDSDVLLLDEPTTYLDLKYQFGILEKARELAEAGRTVIAVLHDFTQASLYADQVAVMHHGRLVGIGKPAEVLTSTIIRDVFDVRTKTVQAYGAVFHVPEHLAQ